MAAYTNFINTMLDTAFTGTKTLHLYTVGVPSGSGVEVSGGSYSAQTVTMSAVSAKVKSLSSSAVFSGLPVGVTIVAYGLKIGGVLVDENNLDQPYTADVSNNTLTLSYSFSLANT